MSPDSSGIDISIIIPNFNNADRLSQCLQAVLSQVHKSVEVIVVDNNSTDDSRNIARSFDVRLLIERDIRSPYACRAKGIENARGTEIVLLDSNCIPLKDWLNEGIKALRNRSADILSGTLVPEYQFDPPGKLERFDYLHSLVWQDNPPVLPAGNLFFKKETYKQSGGFDPDRRSLADTTWTFRATQQGFKLGISRTARFSYPMKSGAAFRNKYIRFGMGRIEEGAKFGWMLVRNILPPNPSFYRQMKKINHEKGTGLGAITLFMTCWYVKLLYGIGTLKGRFKR